MKTRQFLCVCLTVFGTMAALNACKTEKKQYGEPVWGIVTESEPVAQTTCGAVRGENRDGIAIFRGIPYGAPVDGEGRFLPAAPAQPWEGVRDCTKNGPAAIQAGAPSISGNPSGLGEYFNGGHPERFGVAEEVKDENCLVLNVLTPGIDQAKRPVVVYIHGGGFASGTGTLTLGADGWAREEDIVIVGVNHRLNVFGFLYLGDLDPAYASSGMAGMLDLVLALRWVKDNIASFGGDPDCVTIMGESGGGMKVSTLMAMDAAHGLFSKAIVESGSNVVGNFSKEAAAAQAERLLKALGLTRENWKQLLTLPAEEIYAASAGLQLAPVADDINLKYIPGNEIQAYDISKDIPLMVGSSADEMGVFVPIAQMGITEGCTSPRRRPRASARHSRPLTRRATRPGTPTSTSCPWPVSWAAAPSTKPWRMPRRAARRCSTTLSSTMPPRRSEKAMTAPGTPPTCRCRCASSSTRKANSCPARWRTPGRPSSVRATRPRRNSPGLLSLPTAAR